MVAISLLKKGAFLKRPKKSLKSGESSHHQAARFPATTRKRNVSFFSQKRVSRHGFTVAPKFKREMVTFITRKKWSALAMFFPMLIFGKDILS